MPDKIIFFGDPKMDSLTTAEMDIISAKLNDPLLIKYFKSIRHGHAYDLLTCSTSTLTDAELAKAHACLAGKLQVIEDLIIVAETPKEETK